MSVPRRVALVVGNTNASPHTVAGLGASEFDVRKMWSYSAAMSDAELDAAAAAARAGDAECIVCGGGTFIDARLLDRAPRLRCVSVIGVGYDGTDVAELTRRGVWLANAPVLRDACAEMSLLLMLGAMRRAPEGARITAGAGGPSGWDWQVMRGVVGDSPRGKTLGIIGFGRIGQTLAHKAAAAFGMQVIYYDLIREPLVRTQDDGGSRSPPYHQLSPAPRWVPLDELLAESDVVSVHANLTAASYHLMGHREFARMKRGSYFLNAARGGLMDEEALAEALKSGHLAGAGIDVFEHEPRVSPALLARPNAFLLPHLSSAAAETRGEMVERALQNARAVLRGAAPLNPLNAPPQRMRGLPAAEQRRVEEYLAAEFAHEYVTAQGSERSQAAAPKLLESAKYRARL